VLDVYAGVGLFSAFLAERAASVAAIEVAPSAIRDAKANLAGLKAVEVIEGAAESVLGRWKKDCDAVIVDPPRAGLKPKALEALISLQPARVVYVSCDPATLARDAKRLASSGYHLLEVQPVDMFPQTYHIEAVASFQRQP
jgi:23S rRNA (uracil1939-C5)-methyltransferase